MTLRIAILLFTAALAPNYAVAQPAPRADWAQTIYRASGIEPHLETAGEQIVQQMASGQTAQLPPGVRAAIERIVRAEYAAEGLKQDVVGRIDVQIEPARAEQALRWLDSERGRAFTNAEQSLAVPDALARLQAFAQSPEGANPSATRLELVRRLDVATGGTDLAVDLALATALAVAIAADATSRSPKELEVLRQAVDAQRGQLRPMLEGLTRVSYLYVYRGFRDADLEPYLAFLESDNGKWYSRITSKALLGAFTASASRLGTALRKELEAQRASKTL